MIAASTSVPADATPRGRPRGVSSCPGVNAAVYDLDARLTAAQAALYFGLTPQAVNRWYALGHLQTAAKNRQGHRQYVFRELLQAERDTRRHRNSSRNANRRPAQRAA